jgi:hypothetical protein
MEALVCAYPEIHPRVLVLEEAGTAHGFLPYAEIPRARWREIVSLPFGTHGGPVVSAAASPAGIRALVEAFARRLRAPRVFRHELSVCDPSPALREPLVRALGDRLIESTTQVLDLTGGESALWEGYEQQLRRSVRRAGRAQVTVRPAGPEGLDAFHALYAAQTRSFPIPWSHGLPALRALTASPGIHARFWIASRAGRDLCAQMVLERPDRDLHLWISGADPASRPVAAFHLLLHELILEASRRGFRELHLGSSLGNRGVESFKRAFRPRERPLLRFYHQARWAGWVQALRAGLARPPRPGRGEGNEET